VRRDEHGTSLSVLIAGLPVLHVTTTGRKSGQPRTSEAEFDEVLRSAAPLYGGYAAYRRRIGDRRMLGIFRPGARPRPTRDTGALSAGTLEACAFSVTHVPPTI
jgi:hypothetical protein